MYLLTKGFGDWEISSNASEWGTVDWNFFLDDTSSLSQTRVDITRDINWAGDFGKENWFLKSWLRKELASIENSSGGWDELTGTSVNGISMKGGIVNIESNTSHTFVTKNTRCGNNLETGDNRVLDFVHELATSGGVNDHIWSISVWLIWVSISSITVE